MLDQKLLRKFVEDYENARMDGLCHAGAWEVALSQLSQLDLSPSLQQQLAEYLASGEN